MRGQNLEISAQNRRANFKRAFSESSPYPQKIATPNLMRNLSPDSNSSETNEKANPPKQYALEDYQNEQQPSELDKQCDRLRSAQLLKELVNKTMIDLGKFMRKGVL